MWIQRLKLLALLVLLPSGGTSAQQDAREQPAKPESPIVAATVNGKTIHVQDVERELERFAARRKIDSAERPFLLAQTLQQLVDRELILGALRRNGQAANQQEVDLGVERIRRELARRGIAWNRSMDQTDRARENSTTEQATRSLDVDEEELRRTVEWQLSWQGFLDRYHNEENVERYFASHRRQFDGTQLHVAHLLLKAGSADVQTEARTMAKGIREEIAAGEKTWDAAVQEFSTAPTARSGGDLGLISRHEPMPESFSQAAFELERGEISRPVVTAFGVHLIKCLDIQPGTKTLAECRSEVEQAMTRYLFRWAADRERPRATIRYSGAIPLFRGVGDEDISTENGS